MKMNSLYNSDDSNDEQKKKKKTFFSVDTRPPWSTLYKYISFVIYPSFEHAWSTIKFKQGKI